jgi:hypothetical protein
MHPGCEEIGLQWNLSQRRVPGPPDPTPCAEVGTTVEI